MVDTCDLLDQRTNFEAGHEMFDPLISIGSEGPYNLHRAILVPLHDNSKFEYNACSFFSLGNFW